MSTFKEKFSYEKRRLESQKLREKYPNRIPIIIDKHKISTIPDIDKNKFLVPCDITVGHFFFMIRKRINLKKEDAMYIFINDKIPSLTALISSIYKEYKNEDGFLYAIYCSEATFG